MSPFLIICGSIVDPEEEVTVAGENELLLNASGILEAVEMMLVVYYVCNMAYPKECLNTYLFLQRSVLKVFDSQRRFYTASKNYMQIGFFVILY